MRSDVNTMLKRAADCQKFAAPEDSLSAILRAYPAEAELDEGALDRVAAARQLRQEPQSAAEKKEEQRQSAGNGRK